MPELTIRRTTTDDIATLAPFEPRESSSLAETFLAEQEAGEYIFATAWDGEVPMGWGTLKTRESELQPQLAHLWVFPNARRQGVGRAISHWLEDEARRAGFSSVYLRVDPNNSAAIPLWIDLGYYPTGEHSLATDDVTNETTHHAIYRKSLTAED